MTFRFPGRADGVDLRKGLGKSRGFEFGVVWLNTDRQESGGRG
jgi:hypothetical protein